MNNTNTKQITVDADMWQDLCDISDELEADILDKGPEGDHNELTVLYEMKSIVRRIVAQSRHFEKNDKSGK